MIELCCSYQCKDTNLKAIHNFQYCESSNFPDAFSHAIHSSESHPHSAAVHAWGVSLSWLHSGSPVRRFSLRLSTILFFGLNVRAFLRNFAAPKAYGLCLVLPHFGGLMRERGGRVSCRIWIFKVKNGCDVVAQKINKTKIFYG